MSDPYRDSGGVPCPRCNETMAAQDDGGLACGSGCGAWITSGVILKLLGTVDLTKRGIPAPFFKVLGLPPTPCFVCPRELEPLYRSAGDDYVTFGQCAQHGIWCEQRSRADFELAFGKEIGRYAVEVAKPRGRTNEDIANALGDDPHAMADRIIQLEKVVARLTSRLEALERSR